MYRTDIYFICKTLAEAPIFIAVPLVFTTVAYPMVGLHPGVEHFFIAAGILTLIANVATSFGNNFFYQFFRPGAVRYSIQRFVSAPKDIFFIESTKFRHWSRPRKFLID